MDQKRRQIAIRYDQELKELLITPSTLIDVRHIYHLYVVRIKNRKRIQKSLKEKGISTGINNPIPLPFLKAYRYLNHKPYDFSAASKLIDEILSLHINGDMTNEHVEYVIENVKLEINNER